MEELKKYFTQKKYEERKRVEELLPLYREYMINILEWNKKINITSIREEKDFIKKHYIDSLCLLKYKEWFQPKTKVIDIGTGGGFPGIPLALFFKEVNFTLVDSVGKKIDVVKNSIEKLPLSNVTLLKERAENIGRLPLYREKYDLCVSRAVAPLLLLSEICLPLVKIGGRFISYKGEEGEGERKDAEKAIAILGGKIEIMDFSFGEEGMEKHGLIVVRKIKSTPEMYPREMKEIKKGWK